MIEILEMILKPSVVWVFVPITAIVGGLITGVKIEQIKARKQKGLSDEEVEALKNLAYKNEELTERVESLEAIITSMDKELLALKANDDAQLNKQKVKELSEKMKDRI